VIGFSALAHNSRNSYPSEEAFSTPGLCTSALTVELWRFRIPLVPP
jgi:hypothetical protein